jgi:hypothetical protein
MLHAGATRVFLTERDNLGGSFASEGLAGGRVCDPPLEQPIIEAKPAAALYAHLARTPRARPRRH